MYTEYKHEYFKNSYLPTLVKEMQTTTQRYLNSGWQVVAENLCTSDIYFSAVILFGKK